MKKTITSLIVLFTCIIAFAQQKQHQIIYAVTSPKSSPYTVGGNTNIEVKQLLKEVNAKLPDIVYELNFTQNESYFSLKNILKNESNSGLAFNLAKNKGGNDIFYANKKKNKAVKQKDDEGEWLLITSKFNHHKWKLTNQKKKIKGLVCYKATTTFTFESLRKTIIEPVEAWYCPSIPFSFGPAGYEGLPGVILELDNGRVTFYAIRIHLNTQKKLKIKEPTKGKKITEKEERRRDREWLDNFLKKNKL